MQKISIASLSAEEALATSTYLKKLTREFPGVVVAVQSLFGRCCLASAFDLNLEELAAEAQDLGSQVLNHPESERLGLDPLLLIEIRSMLQQAGKKLEPLDELLLRIASALAAQPAETRRIGRVRNIAAKLASGGFPIRNADKTPEMSRLVDSPDRWFGCSVAQLSELVCHLTADSEPLDEISTRILSLLALAELRNYRVDLGCLLLRAVFELGEPCMESSEALHFIALQRRRDGRYGFPNQFASGTTPEGDPQLSVFLPLTVNVAWLFRIQAEHHQRRQSAMTA